ncbi:hypothetical protein D3C85_1574350 [compost metagenome]
MSNATPSTPALHSSKGQRPTKDNVENTRASSCNNGPISSTLNGTNTNRRSAVISSGTSNQ